MSHQTEYYGFPTEKWGKEKQMTSVIFNLECAGGTDFEYKMRCLSPECTIRKGVKEEAVEAVFYALENAEY